VVTYWQQALKASHAAPILTWIHWPQAPVILIIGLVVSWVSLSYRYMRKGRPFGSRAAWRRSAAIIVLTAFLGTVLGVLLPRLPVTVGALIPALLCADRSREGRGESTLNAVENPAWFGVITLGVSILLNWLENQMAQDREEWCESQADRVGSLDDIELAARNMLGTLTRAGISKHQREKLLSDCDDICAAVAKAKQAQSFGEHEEAREHTFAAKQALLIMLGRAYNWGHTKIGIMAGRPGQQPKAGVT
jgi:hypothetical protein